MYFLDTYALIEIVKGNPNFKKFLEKKAYTTINNLFELHYILSREENEEVAREIFIDLKRILISFNDEHIFFATRLKLKNKRISYVDALGYSISIKENMRFVTGDKEFKGVRNVDFISG